MDDCDNGVKQAMAKMPKERPSFIRIMVATERKASHELNEMEVSSHEYGRVRTGRDTAQASSERASGERFWVNLVMDL